MKIAQAGDDRVAAVPLHSLQVGETEIEELGRAGAAIGHPEQRRDQQHNEGRRAMCPRAGQPGQRSRLQQQPGGAEEQHQRQGRPAHRERQVPDLQQGNNRRPASPEGEAEPEQVERVGAEQPPMVIM